MSSHYRRAAFIFRRDLRLDDNTGLLAASRMAEEIVPCFIFDPRQVEAHPFRSLNALQYMIEALTELDDELRSRNGCVHLFYGQADEVIDRLLSEAQIDAIFFNADYTPFSRNRDDAIAERCRKRGAPLHVSHDALLTIPGTVLTKERSPYHVFTPFERAARREEVAKAEPLNKAVFVSAPIHFEVDRSVYDQLLPVKNSNLFVRGGRAAALKQLQRSAQLTAYDDDRNFPSRQGGSNLSAANKFGVCSIREVYHTILEAHGEQHVLIRELYWRDFFTHLAFFYPRVFEGPFDLRYRSLKWENREILFDAWCAGRTGYPIVDAGMRQLAATGFMHNRVRMIVASFLIKDLHIDYRWGERYFAQHLVDYDPCVNNGNWQWAASTGADAQPYFRVFNPWAQQRRFDPQAEYIRDWIDELRTCSADEIHQLEKPGAPRPADYPAPIVDHSRESALAKARFKEAWSVQNRSHS